MDVVYKFEITVKDDIEVLINGHYDTLESTPDDFFEQTIVDNSKYYRINKNDLEIGYFSLDEEGKLIQFYVIDEMKEDSKTIIEQIIEDYQCASAIVPTYDPIYFESIEPFCIEKSIQDNLYILNKKNYDELEEEEIIVRLATLEDLDLVVDLEEKSLDGATRDGLLIYCKSIIEKKGLYLFFINRSFVGVGESRTWYKKGSTFLCVIVAPKFRSKGIGEFIISYLIKLGLKDNLSILTSAKETSINSNKMLESLGFENKSQILNMKLK
ncbi:MAG: hypothetical protein JJE21_10970 [Spirochaetaceae bacterium]|nr:hypothetical protein [Spirochaetaceae bacterium]